MYGCMDVWMYVRQMPLVPSSVSYSVRQPAHQARQPASIASTAPQAQEQAAESGGGPMDGRPDMERTVGYGVSKWVWVWVWVCVSLSVCVQAMYVGRRHYDMSGRIPPEQCH